MNHFLKLRLAIGLLLIVAELAVYGLLPGVSRSQGPNEAQVGGVVFFDANADGLSDDEPGLGGFAVEIRDAATGGETFMAATITAADGSYAFASLTPGDYLVSQPTAPGYTHTTPASQPVTVAPGETAAVDFGIVVLRTVSGTVYTDWNENGEQDLIEPPVQEALVELFDDADGDGFADPGEPLLGAAVSDDQGNYAIPGILPGLRVLRVQPPGGTGEDEQSPLPVFGGQMGGGNTVDVGLRAHTATPLSPTVLSPTAARCADDRLTVRFVAGTAQVTIDRILNRFDVEIIRLIEPLDIYVLGAPAGDARDIVRRLNRLAAVDYAAVDCKVGGEATPALNPKIGRAHV